MTTEIIHKSKIGYEILIPLVLILGTTTTMVIMKGAWTGIIACTLVIIFIAHIYTTTHYKITPNNHLIIKCGFILTWEIEIKDIYSIRKTNSILSSPALSIDRLEINYTGGQVLISPKDKEKFIADLRKVNPKI